MSDSNFETTGTISDTGTPAGSTGSMAGGTADVCPTCGQPTGGKRSIEEMLSNLKAQFQAVDLDEYMNTAREYLKTGSTKATTFAKENPAKIAAGAAALALGAGLLYAAMHRGEKTPAGDPTSE